MNMFRSYKFRTTPATNRTTILNKFGNNRGVHAYANREFMGTDCWGWWVEELLTQVSFN